MFERAAKSMSEKAEKGVFVCVEGLDGSGKTTQARILVRNLRRKGFDAVYTTEPSEGKVGKLIRRDVLDRDRRVSSALEALLFAADRVDHVETVIKPSLKLSRVVVCDRYVYSSLAYQGAAGLDLDWIDSVNRFAFKPDLALLIDVQPEVAIKRLKRKKTVMETRRNQEKVRDVYMSLVQEQRLVLVDGNKPVRDVASDVLKVVLGFLRSEHRL